MDPGTFFTELKRRKVYRIAVAYAIVAWLLIQAASILFPTFEAPPWVMKVFVTAVILGFPIALILAWAFEMTPQGIRREEELAPRESRTRKSGSKWTAVIVIAAVAAAGLFAFQFTRTRKSATAELPKQLRRQLRTWTNQLPCCHSRISVRTKRTRFLPRVFRMKSSPRYRESAAPRDLAHFHREYKSAPENLPEIAQQLRVSHVLEGSVQKAGDRVHINVQLIRAEDDAHLWAQSYDRQLTDIFG